MVYITVYETNITIISFHDQTVFMFKTTNQRVEKRLNND